MSKLTDCLEAMFQPVLESLGLALVRVLVMGKKSVTLQVMIERMDTQTVSMDDCVKVSRAISALLDIEDPITSTYNLEVTSPGLDRPLLKPRDFQRFTGSAIHITLLAPREEGIRKYKGILKNADNNGFELEVKGLILKIAYEELGQAKLDPEFKFSKFSKG